MLRYALALACTLPALAHASPTSAELRGRAHAKMEAAAAGEAAKLLEEAIRADPDDAEAWAELGNARLALSEFPQAATAFEQAVKLAPDLATAQYNLAYALRKAGKLPRAAEAYRVYLARYPSDADAHFGLGETLRGLGDNLAAAEAYERYAAAESRPDRTAWVEKATTWAKELRAKEVKPVTRGAADPHLSFAADAPPAAAAAAAAAPAQAVPPAAAAASPHPPELASGLGLLKEGRFAEALDTLRKAEAASSADPWVQAALGSALLALDEPADAAVYYTRALASAPAAAQAGVRLGLAEAARRQGDTGRAEAEYRAILADAAAPRATQDIARQRLGQPAL